MLAQINTIPNIAKAEAVYASLSASYAQRVGVKQAEHSDRMFQRVCEFKPNGLAWWKARCRSVAFNLVSEESTVNHFIAASPETAQWGGFLGGDRVVYANKAAAADAEAMIANRIAGL